MIYAERSLRSGSHGTWRAPPAALMQRNGVFQPSDLRKSSEQHGDFIGWDQSNRAYILTHGVSGVNWTHYKHPLPEHVYNGYMQYLKDVRLTC